MNIFEIINDFLHKNNYTNTYKIGEGIHSIVYYTYNIDESIPYALKIYKNGRDIAKDAIILRKMDDYRKEICPNVLLLTYRGESLDKIGDKIKKKFTIEDCFEKLMITLKKFHCLGYLHNDIKPDNISYDFENDQFHLLDVGMASRISNVSNTSNTSNTSNKSYFRGNIFWSLRACIRCPWYESCIEDDIESLILTVWYIYYGSLPWIDYYTHNTHNTDIENILMLREDLSLCPYPFLRKFLQHIRTK